MANGKGPHLPPLATGLPEPEWRLAVVEYLRLREQWSDARSEQLGGSLDRLAGALRYIGHALVAIASAVVIWALTRP